MKQTERGTYQLNDRYPSPRHGERPDQTDPPEGFGGRRNSEDSEETKDVMDILLAVSMVPVITLLACLAAPCVIVVFIFG